MQLSNEELIQIKKDFNDIKEKLIKKNNIIKDKIIKSISDYNQLTEFQKKLYEKFQKSFDINILYNEILSYFIQMNINTYEQAFQRFHSQAIICSLRNSTDFNDNIEESIEIENDITKNLLNGINYFKKNFIIKIFEAEIDLNKIKNIANITIPKDNITCMKYLNSNSKKILVLGSMLGKIYLINLDQKKCFMQIQAHKEEEENTGNWGILYINIISGNRLISCCEDGTMKLWEIIDKSNNNIDIKYVSAIRGHKDMVRKVIELKRGKNEKNKKIKIVSCSYDFCLGFWEEKSKNKFEILKLVKSHKFWINDIYEIFDGRIFVIGGENDPSLKVWNPFDYSFESINGEIFSVNHDCIIEINKDYYIFGGSHTYLSLFRLSGKMIIRLIYIEEMYINSLMLLRDGNLLVDSGKNMIKYADIGNYKVKEAIKTNSNSKINYYMLSLNLRSFVTSDRNNIKLWEY